MLLFCFAFACFAFFFFCFVYFACFILFCFVFVLFVLLLLLKISTRPSFLSPPKKIFFPSSGPEGAQEALDAMNYYDLMREDLDNINEISQVS